MAFLMQPPVLLGFSEISRSAKEVLYGSRREGTFQVGQKLNFSTVTANGLTFGASASKSDDNSMATSLQFGYTARNLATPISLDATLIPGGTLSLSGVVSELYPGAKLTATTSFLSDGKFSPMVLGADYTDKTFTVKCTGSVTSRPVLGLSFGMGFGSVLAGADLQYNTLKNAMSRWSAGLGYHDIDNRFQVGAFLTDSGDNAQLLFAQNLGSTDAVSLELVKPLNGKEGASGQAPAVGSLAYARRLPGGGLAKAKLDNSGMLSALYESNIVEGGRINLSAHLDSSDFSKPPKIGFSLDLP